MAHCAQALGTSVPTPWINVEKSDAVLLEKLQVCQRALQELTVTSDERRFNCLNGSTVFLLTAGCPTTSEMDIWVSAVSKQSKQSVTWVATNEGDRIMVKTTGDIRLVKAAIATLFPDLKQQVMARMGQESVLTAWDIVDGQVHFWSCELAQKIAKCENHILLLEGTVSHSPKGKSGRAKKAALNTQIQAHKESLSDLTKKMHTFQV